MSAANVHGKLHYLADVPLYQREKPYELTLDLWYSPKQKSANTLLQEKEISIRDMSNVLETFSTDVHGFQALRYPTECSDDECKDVSSVDSKYYQECENLFKDRFGANEVFIFDSMFRKANTPLNPAEVNKPYAMLQSALGLHVDQTPDSARRRVAHCLPDRAEELLKGRVQILNIWRPLVSRVENHPLLLCDYRTTKQSQLIPADVISPLYHGEQYWVRHSPEHQYWYYGDMSRDDVYIIKCYDSAAQTNDAIAKFAPHGAFTFDNVEQDSQPRESFEIRALVFSDE